MHDPMTVAFEIRRPWPERRIWANKKWYWPNWITIWHVDPETDGSDDSCDWFGARLTKQNGWWPGIVDELKMLSPEAQEAVKFVWWQWRDKLGRPWWRHPKWHVHHWIIQIHPLQQAKRWLFSRCTVCGKRFSWHESSGCVVSCDWGGSGPAFFKNAENIMHFACASGARPAVDNNVNGGHIGEATDSGTARGIDHATN